MNESETTTDPSIAEVGFRISKEPLVGGPAFEAQPPSEAASTLLGELPDFYGNDLLYAIARDPNSLFLYWDLDWARLFSEVGLTPEAVHLRISRDDGSHEKTIAIEPARGFCFADVTAAGSRYFCELGYFAGPDWKSLVRSASTDTPAASLSGDFTAEFATLPLHLAFQRLTEILRATQPTPGNLASSVAEMQGKVRVLQDSVPEKVWPWLLKAAAALVTAGTDSETKESSTADLAEVLQVDRKEGRRQTPSPNRLERWKTLGETFSGASGSSFGGSSPA